MPKYSQETIQQVTEANDIVDIVSGYVSLKQRGNSFMGCCPFHHEKTPSFSVSRDKQLYHCFGCGAGGNLIQFVMNIEQLTFPEAVKFLGDKAGLALTEAEYETAEEKAAFDRRQNLYEMHRQLANYYYLVLKKSPEALTYLHDRGLSDEHIRSFGIGFAPAEWHKALDYLIHKGFSMEDILASGLVLTSQNGSYYDRFRGRIMFPIQNPSGKLVGFGGRKISEEDKGPKYLNSPETDIFIKGRNLYNLNRAKKSFSGGDPLILVEGYMDVTALASFGFANTAAALGTAFTPEHAALISRYTNDVVLCFDGDTAGEQATIKALKVFGKSELHIRIVRLPPEHDPDTFIRANGTDAFREELRKAMTPIDFSFMLAGRGLELDSSDGKLTYIKRAMTLLQDSGEIETDLYIKKLSTETGISEKVITERLRKPVIEREQTQTVILDKTQRRLPREFVEAQKVYFNRIIEEPALFNEAAVREEMFTNGFFRWLYKHIAEATPQPVSLALLSADPNHPDAGRLLAKLCSVPVSKDQSLFDRSVQIIQRQYTRTTMEKLEQEMLTADSDRKMEISEELVRLKKSDWS